MLDAEDAEYVGSRLPQRTHCYDPAVALAVHDGLDNVCSKNETEQNGEEVCGSRARAKCRPLSVWICSSWAAPHRGLQIQRKSSIAEWISAGTLKPTERSGEYKRTCMGSVEWKASR